MLLFHLITFQKHSKAPQGGIRLSHSQVVDSATLESDTTHNPDKNICDRPPNDKNSSIRMVVVTPTMILMERAKACKRAWSAIQGLAQSKVYETQSYSAIWKGKEKPQFNAAGPIERYAALQHILDVNEVDAAATRYKRRMAMLLGNHELDAIGKAFNERGRSGGTKIRTYAVEELANRLKKTKKDIHCENRRRRHYVLMFHKVGPGAILLLGEDSNTLNL